LFDRKAYKSFINGRYLSEGLRITAGILFPALLLGYLNMLSTGIVMSVGALCVSAADTPGPVQNRAYGMLSCVLVIGIVTVVVCYSTGSPLLLGTIIFAFGFLFSMITVYGTRTSALGIAALLVMILHLQTNIHGIHIWTNALFIVVGGTWYMLYSLAVYSIRPYKLIRQISGDFIQSIADYLRTRAAFYGKQPEYEKIRHLLLKQQLNVQQQQNQLSELLFKTRAIIKESTRTGRTLLKIFLDAGDLFESIMSSFSEYKVLHLAFDETGILDEFKTHILALADEMDEIGLAVKSGLRSHISNENIKKISETRAHFETLRLKFMNDANIENFISLGRIMQNIEEVARKIQLLHTYTRYKKINKAEELRDYGYSDYLETTDIRPSLFVNNLNFNSNIFRHSLRVSFAMLVGYGCSLLLHLGHSYWILLTIVVILKPAYSLTKKRNTDRLIGTISGVIIGVVILLLIKNNTALLIIMIFFMAISYVFLRTSYFTSVLFMTPYLVIFFHLFYPQNLKMVLTDRLVDTALGSGISFLASIFLVPQWSHTTIRIFMVKMIESNTRYFSLLARPFAGADIPKTGELKKTRKDVLTGLANLTDAFTQMLSEPKRFQKSTETIHQFVVLNHTLVSHLATLSYYLNVKKNKFNSVELFPVIENTVQYFNNAIHHLEQRRELIVPVDKITSNKLNELTDQLLDKRKKEISVGLLETETKTQLVNVKSVTDQFNYILNIAAEIYKSCRDLDP
jgi:uncharacterized membrane protein YccC